MFCLERAYLTFGSIEKLLSITIDFDLKFDKNLSDAYDGVSKKLAVLCRISGYMSLEKRRND